MGTCPAPVDGLLFSQKARTLEYHISEKDRLLQGSSHRSRNCSGLEYDLRAHV